MSQRELEPLVYTGFQLVPEITEGELVIGFAGNGDMSAVETLGAYLKRVHEVAVARGCKQVAFDFRELYFMNSSCFKAFVTWIDGVSRGGEPYSIHFRTNPRLHWQRRSLEALRCLSPKLVRIEALDP